MKYLISGTLRPERSREEFVAKVKDKVISDQAWELVQKGVITEHGFKIGRRPGFILVMEGDTEEAVWATITNLPFAGEGWFDIEVDPMSPFLSDIR